MTHPPPRHPRTAVAAFTLIEVLLAVAIFGVVLVAIQAIFHGALRLRNRTTQAIEDALPLDRALATLRRDLANIVPPGGTLAGSLTTSPTTDGLLNQPLLQFQTSVGTLSDTAPWGDIQRVAYSLAAPTNRSAGSELHRVVTQNLLPVNQELYDDHPLLGGVDSIAFSFYDGTAWRETWDSTNEIIPLPRAIRVSLTLVDTNINRTASRPQPIELIVALLVEPATNTTSTSTSTSTDSTGGGS